MLRDPSFVLAAPAKLSLLSPRGARSLSSSHFFSGVTLSQHTAEMLDEQHWLSC